VILNPKSRKEMLESVLIRGERVSEVCKRFKVTRSTFYKWAREYRQRTGKLERKHDSQWGSTTTSIDQWHLKDARFKDPHNRKLIVSDESYTAGLILWIVSDTPRLGPGQIVQKATDPKYGGEPLICGRTTVYNYLEDNGLNKYQGRRSFSTYVRNRRREYSIAAAEWIPPANPNAEGSVMPPSDVERRKYCDLLIQMLRAWESAREKRR